ncbi:MAG TPA: hypothetical protein VII11_11980 [Bacteroidota bacterium]
MESQAQAFTYNCARSGSITAGIIVAILFETVALHALLWNYWWIAWPLTLLNIQLVYWFYSDYRAMAEKTIQLSGDALRIDFGNQWAAQIPIAEIESAHALTWKNQPEPSKEYLKVSGYSDPNLLVRFRKPMQFKGPFGIKRTARSVGLVLDEPELFEKSLTSQTQNSGRLLL